MKKNDTFYPVINNRFPILLNIFKKWKGKIELTHINNIYICMCNITWKLEK